MWSRLRWLACGSLLWCGCGSYEVTSQPEHVVRPPAPAAAEPASAANDEQPTPDDPAADEPALDEPGVDDPDVDDPETRDLGDVDAPENFGDDPLTAPLAVFLNVRDRPELLRMQQAVRDFKTIEGRFPADLEEFMEQIVKVNEIQLPPPQPGYKLDYLPEKGQLIQRKVE